MPSFSINSLLRRASLFTVAATSLLLLQCQEQGSFNPAGPDLRLVIVSDLTAFPNRVPAGGGTSVISGRVIDQQQKPFLETRVAFDAAKGSITLADTTDSLGRFSADYRSGSTAGLDTVTVIIQDASFQVLISVVGVSAELTLNIYRNSLLANGTDTTNLIATLIGNEGPITRVPVKFETTAGNFNGQSIAYANTDNGGIAGVLITAPSSNTEIVGTVTATVEDQTVSIPLGSGDRGLRGFKADLPHIAGVNAEANSAITFRGVSIQVEADEIMLPGDGLAATKVRALVKEENHQAIKDALVNFSAQLGSIPVSATTNASGVAEVTLTSKRSTGAVDQIIARYGPVLADTLGVTYASAVNSVELFADPSSVLADGINPVKITARVTGGTGLAASGFEVVFSCDFGVVYPERVVTNNQGQAQTYMIPPGSEEDWRITVWGEVTVSDEAVATSPLPNGTAAVTTNAIAARDSRGDRARMLRPVSEEPGKRDDVVSGSVIVPVRGVTLQVSVSPDSIIARGGESAAVTALVRETTSGNPVSGDTVRFATNLGSISSFGILDRDGRTIVSYLASDQIGSSQILARYGAFHRDSTAIALLPTIGRLQLGADRNSMLAGGLDTALVVVQVTDALGGASPNVGVVYRIGDDPTSYRTFTDNGGIAHFAVVSPTIDGQDQTLTIHVSAGDLTENLDLLIKSVSRLVTASPDSMSAGSETPVTIAFRAFESASHRPVVGDTVWFSAEQGVMQPYAVLDHNGIARNSFLVGSDVGANWVIGQLGTLQQDSVRIELVEPIAALALSSLRPSILSNGDDTTQVIARVSNILGQPTPRVWVRFETDAGQIAPTEAMTDEAGRAFALFSGIAGHDDSSATIRAVATHLEPRNAALSSGSSLATTVAALGLGSSLRRTRPLGTPGERLVPAPALARKELTLRPIDADEVSDTKSIRMRGVTLDLRLDPRTLHADGSSRAAVNVQLSETTNGSPIARAVVRFGATMGVIREEASTGQNGTLVDSLTAGLVPGHSAVTASYGNVISAVDSIRFTPDPARLNLDLSLDPGELPADGGSETTIRARVTDTRGDPVPDVEIRFTHEGGQSVLIDPEEYREVTRWQNTFRVENPNLVTAMRLRLFLRGVDNPVTRILLNRDELNVDLPRDPLWQEATLELPTGQLNGGVNRIEIVGGREQDVADCFSVAGIRLELVGSYLIGEATSDANGWVETQATADQIEGIYLVRAAVIDDPNRFVEETLTLLPQDPALVLVAPVADTLLASGIDETDLVILVADANGNAVSEGHQVQIAADPVGRVDPEEDQTLGDGTVSARFFAPASEENAATELAATCGGIEGRWPMLLQGAALSLTSETDRMLANARNAIAVQARLETADGVPVRGRAIAFTTTLGNITPSVQTDADGVAIAALASGDSVGTATVTAAFGPDITRAIQVTFVPPVADVSLSANPTSLRGNGKATAALTVAATDGLGGGAPVVRLTLAADRGRLSQTRLTTDIDGFAAATLTGISSVVDDTLTVTVSADDYALADTLRIPIRGVTLDLTSDQDSLIARDGASAAVTARAYETTTGNPVTGDTIRFAASRGFITASAPLNLDGVAQVNFSAGQDVGRAEIIARYSVEHRDTLYIDLLSRVGGMTASSARNSLLSGGIDSALVTAVVTDPLGGPSPDVPVAWELDWDAGAQHYVRTDEQGIAQFYVASPAAEADSALRVTVTAGDFSEELRIALRAITRSLSATPDSLSAGNNGEVEVNFRAIETASRRPVTGDSVWFSATDGTIQPFGALDHNGSARVVYTVGDNPGEVWVIGRLGTLKPDSIRIVQVDPVATVAITLGRNSILANGEDTIAVQLRVSNLLGQPSANAVVTLAANVGSFDRELLETDANGDATAVYTGSAETGDQAVELIAAAMPGGRARQLGLNPGDDERLPQNEELYAARGPVRDAAPRPLPVRSAMRLDEGLAAIRGDQTLPWGQLLQDGDAADTAAVELRGISLTLRADPRVIAADGRSKAGVNIQLREATSGRALSGAEIRLGASRGAIRSSGMTGDDGTLVDSITAGVQPGTSVVRASYGNTITATDTVTFSYDPGSLKITFTISPTSAPADTGNDITLTARVTDKNGAAVEGVPVRFTIEDAKTVLIDAEEHRQTTRWENSFLVDDPELATGLRLTLQLRGVDDAGTKLHVNRTAQDAELTRDPLWGNYVVNLSSADLIQGGNRIEIVGGETGGVQDRFSVAGVRVGLIGSHLIDELNSDANGEATAIIPADPTAGYLRLRAALTDAPERYAERRLALTPGAPDQVLVATSADTLLGNGLEESDLLAIVTDLSGNPVGDGLAVDFSVDSTGSVSPSSALTLGDGTASARFTAPATAGNINTSVIAECDGIQGSWTLLLRGVTLELASGADRLLADGRSTTAINARLSTADGAPVSGKRIDFSTTRGSIARSALTDDQGFAAATLTAANTPGTATVIAAFGPSIADTISVAFTNLVGSLTLASDNPDMLADGGHSVSVTVSTRNGLDDAAEGVRITLASDKGRLSRNQVTTGAGGEATATLTGITSINDDSIRVIASEVSGSLADTIYIGLRGITVSVSSDADSLAGNGVATANVTARVVETTSGNPVTEGRVSFSANLGSIVGSVALDEAGAASAVYTAPSSTGTATIRARFGDGLDDQTSIVLIDPVSALSLNISPVSILADGVAATTVTARVTDLWGNPAPNQLVTLNFSGPGRVTPQLGYTDHNGILSASAKGDAATSNGLLIITAEARGGVFTETDTLRLRGVTIDLSASPSLIAGDGRSTSTIMARVRESANGRAVPSGQVSFSTSAGSIPASADLNESGEASVSLRSDAYAAIATVVAAYGDELTDTARVAFANRFSYLDARGGRSILLADGEDTTRIAVTLTDTLGQPVEGVWIGFQILGGNGSLTADSAATNLNGIAGVLYSSAALTSDVASRVRAFAGTLSDTVSLGLRGITISVSADPDTLPANGIATSLVVARVRQTSSGNPITGRSAHFQTDAGLIPSSATLDSLGRATVRLTADDAAGTATIAASFGQTLTATTPVVYLATIGSVTLTAEHGMLLGDGVSGVQVTARVLDQLGNPVDGVGLSFSAPDGGKVSPTTAQTGLNGETTIAYTGFATRTDSVVVIEVVTAGGAADDASVRLLGITTGLSASPNRLPANGRATATIRFSADETTAHNPVTGQTVIFSADRGSIGRSATLDSSGQAQVTFTAPAIAGTATIVAVMGDTLQTLLSLPCESSLPARALLSVEPRAVSIAGIGRDESATLTAEVTDADRNPVPDGTAITLTVLPDIGVTFSGGNDTLETTTEDGAVRATVSAGDQSGIVSFRAIYSGSVLATGAELVVRSGPAAQITVRPDVGTIYHPQGGSTAFPVFAIVGDRFSNPVEDSTVVSFRLDPDTLAQITAIGYTEGGVVLTPVGPIDYPTGVWLTYSNDRAGSRLYVHASAGGGVAHDSIEVTLPGAIVGGEPDRIVAAIDTAVVRANGLSHASVTVSLYDDQGQPVADFTEVTFTATLGSIQRTRFTSAGAVANTYLAGKVAGLDTIRISAGAVTDEIIVRLLPGEAASIVVTAADSMIRGGGIQATTITAQARDQFNNPVGAGRYIFFETELGTLDNDAPQTDSSGTARTRLVSGNIIGVTHIMARSGIATGETLVRFISGSADGLVLNSINRNTIGVRGSGAPETATLVFEVRDEWGIPIDSLSRERVDFTLQGPNRVINPLFSSADSIAYLQPASDTTDANGRVAVNLNSGYFAGTVKVTASIGGGAITGEAISVAIHGGPPDLNHFSLITERCVLTGILGTEVDTTTLTAAVGDRFANPVQPGTTVYFTASGGVIEGSGQTDSSGICNARLMTTNPWAIQGLDTIIAQTVDWQNQEIQTTNVVLVTGPTIVSFDTSSGWMIPFGSYRDFAVTVADSFDHPLTAGTTVTISVEALDAQGGAVDGVKLTGEAVDQPYILGECDGKKDFYARIFNFVTGLEGAFVTLKVGVESRNGNVLAEISGAALGQEISAANSRVVLSPNEIIADGEDACEVAVTVYDVLGIAIPTVPPDRIGITCTAGSPLVTPPAASTDDKGRTTGSIVGRALGTGDVLVSVAGILLDDQPSLSFVPGPPANITVQVLNRRLVVGGDTTTVIADVTDKSGNPTEDGTAVIFQANDGSFIPSAATTVAGRATSLFYSGVTAGDATFTVTASRRGGEASEDVANITFLPGPPFNISIIADQYAVQAGSTNELTITALDQYGNTVDRNSRLNLSVDPSGNGSIAPLSVYTDEKGSATASYTAGTVAGDTAHVVVQDVSGSVTVLSPLFVFQPALPGNIIMVASADTVTVGSPVTMTVNVEDSYGNPSSDTTLVVFSRNPLLGTLNPSAVNTSGGVASTRLSGVTQAGDVEVSATAGNVVGSARVYFAAGGLVELSVTAAPAQIGVGKSTTITVTARDAYGNPVSGALIDFAISFDPGGCSLQHAQRTTGRSGVASTIFTAGGVTGSAVVTVTWDDDPAIEASTFIDIQ